MKQLFRLFLLLSGLSALGVGWFWLVESWNFVDAVYMTVITLSTVGYSEVRPLDESGRWFVIFYLSAGLGIFMFGLLQFGEVVLQAELNQWWRRRNMDQTIKSLQDHFIVCGCGRMGQMVCQHLANSKSRLLQSTGATRRSSFVNTTSGRSWREMPPMTVRC